MERSCNLRSNLKNDILEAVSSLRNYFVRVQTILESKTGAYKNLKVRLKKAEKKCRG
jgi:hypothetical protein